MGHWTWIIMTLGLPVLLLAALCVWRWWSRGDLFSFLHTEWLFLSRSLTYPRSSGRSSPPSSGSSSGGPLQVNPPMGQMAVPLPRRHECLFHVEPCLCIASEEEKEAMGVAADALLGSVNGEKVHAVEVLHNAVESGVARQPGVWPPVPPLHGTEPEV